MDQIYKIQNKYQKTDHTACRFGTPSYLRLLKLLGMGSGTKSFRTKKLRELWRTERECAHVECGPYCPHECEHHQRDGIPGCSPFNDAPGCYPHTQPAHTSSENMRRCSMFPLACACPRPPIMWIPHDHHTICNQICHVLPSIILPTNYLHFVR